MLRTFEFETNIENGLIVLPEHLKNVKAEHSKITVIIDDKTQISQKEALSSVFEKMKQLQMFQDITDAVQWQKELRDTPVK